MRHGLRGDQQRDRHTPLGRRGSHRRALLTGALTYWRERRATRRDRAIRLYERFHSESMLNARTLAHDSLFATKPMSRDEVRALSRVLHFFEEVQVLWGEKSVDGRLVTFLLRRYVDYWHRDVKGAGTRIDEKTFGAQVEALQTLSEKCRRVANPWGWREKPDGSPPGIASPNATTKS